MARSFEISTRRLAIDKANVQVVAITGVAAFVTVFCIFAARAVWDLNSYQARVIKEKQTANNQLQENVDNYKKLKSRYSTFNKSNPNIIGGNSDGQGDRDGDNSKIILNALPSKYDFPALASSLEKIVVDNGAKLSNITGTDDEVSQSANVSSPEPKAVDMPFTFTIDETNYTTVNTITEILQRSIRPIVVDSMQISGATSEMTFTIEAHTQYQPAKSLEVKKKVVK